MARVIAICNQKGGVGKTTTSVNLSVYLTLLGRKVLLVDFDPQANATSSFGINTRKLEKSVYHGIMEGRPEDIIYTESSIMDHHVLPSSLDLAGAPIEMAQMNKREGLLRHLLLHLRHLYDYIIIDLPPSLGLLTINGLVAADEIIIPVQAEYYSLEGLGQVLQTRELIRENLGHDLRVAGALLTMYDNKFKLAQDVAEDLRSNFPHHVYNVEIPRANQLAEAPSFSKSIFKYAPGSRGARAYMSLAREVVNQEFYESLRPKF